MENLRIYGKPPFNVAVIHGGPGAPGGMAPVARELCGEWGVLEPLQTAASLDGQIQELCAVLEQHADPPVTLIGSSWGAMLSFMVAARCPSLVKKLILVGSGIYDAKYAVNILPTRLSRLNEDEKREVLALSNRLNDPAVGNKNEILAQLGRLFTRADAYNPLTLETEVLECQYAVHQSVWQEAEAFRASGELVQLGRSIECPVIAIHGDYDPHPPKGIREPLAAVLKNFRFISLQNCGHLPWIEREAQNPFFVILKDELRS